MVTDASLSTARIFRGVSKAIAVKSSSVRTGAGVGDLDGAARRLDAAHEDRRVAGVGRGEVGCAAGAVRRGGGVGGVQCVAGAGVLGVHRGLGEGRAGGARDDQPARRRRLVGEDDQPSTGRAGVVEVEGAAAGGRGGGTAGLNDRQRGLVRALLEVDLSSVDVVVERHSRFTPTCTWLKWLPPTCVR